jgi:cell division protein ZapE
VSLRAQYDRLVTERGFSADPGQLEAVARLDELRDRLITADEAEASVLARLIAKLGSGSPRPLQRGLYLWGSVGRGKTWLMDLFYQSLPFAERRRRHFHRFMYDVHAELRSLQHQEAPLELVAERIAASTRVLCFDEFFVSDIADAMILAGLLEGLFRRGVTLVATSNVRPSELYKDGLQRQRFVPAIELIERNTEVFAVGGRTDYRLRQLTQAGTYVASSAADAVQRLQVLFAKLADHSPVSGGTVEIEDRSIPVILQSEGIVWFGFAALCSGPRSQNDYIEIARNYQSVIVSDVPVLDSEHENEARRFIALVDELYDHNVNLIVSAEAAPPDLYRGERLAAQFERTVSRLTEMQSEEYLAKEHRP